MPEYCYYCGAKITTIAFFCDRDCRMAYKSIYGDENMRRKVGRQTKMRNKIERLNQKYAILKAEKIKAMLPNSGKSEPTHHAGNDEKTRITEKTRETPRKNGKLCSRR